MLNYTTCTNTQSHVSKQRDKESACLPVVCVYMCVCVTVCVCVCVRMMHVGVQMNI